MRRTYAIGQQVLTRQGEPIGDVAGVAGTYFRVASPGQPDYWLCDDCVDGARGDITRVVVDFDREQLGEHRQNEPWRESANACVSLDRSGARIAAGHAYRRSDAA